MKVHLRIHSESPSHGQRRRPRLITLVALTLVTLLLGASLYYYQHMQHNAAEEDQQGPFLHPPIEQLRPGFTLPDIHGALHDINEWNNRVVVVNFWASWCKPCRHEIPLFTRLQSEKGRLGLQFVGIAIDETPAVNKFIADLDTPVNYPMLVGRDEAITIAMQYGNEFGILPYSVIIDRNGHIAFVQYGEFEEGVIEKELSNLL